MNSLVFILAVLSILINAAAIVLLILLVYHVRKQSSAKIYAKDLERTYELYKWQCKVNQAGTDYLNKLQKILNYEDDSERPSTPVD